MAEEKTPINLDRLDVRVVERYINEGKITREEYQAYLDTLPDDSDDAVPINTRLSRNRDNAR